MRVQVAIFVLALALPSAAQELPAAPSAAQQQAREKAFRAQMDAPPPNLSHRLAASDKSQNFVQDSTSPFTFSAAAESAGMASPNGARNLQGRAAAATTPQTGGFLGKVVSSLLGPQSPGAQGKQTLGARLVGALSRMADVDDGPDTPQVNYSQFLGMAVSDTVANAYYPLDAHGMRRTGGGFGARLDANSGIVQGFLPGLKKIFVGQKALQRQRDALTWRTGAAAQTPESVH